METSKQNNKKKFLQNHLRDDVTKLHQTYLGTEIPENYFVKSKDSILKKIQLEKETNSIKKQKVIWLTSNLKYVIAASLVFILCLTVWLQNNINNNKELNKDLFAYTDDVLVNALLIADDEVEAFTESTLLQEVVIKAEISEQKMDDLILNSLILEDSLLDDYIDDEFVKTIIL